MFAPKLASLNENEKSIEAFEGNTATFECPIQNQRPDQFEITWMQRGRPLNTDSKHFSISLDKTRLSILDVHKGDEGEYQCVVRNRAGEMSSQFELNVLGVFSLSQK